MNRSIEEQLQKDGFLFKLTIGKSMEPMLHQWQEQPVIEGVKSPLKRYDVVLFKRENGQYVLHRIVGKKGDCYRIRGDNCFSSEIVPASRILGILTGFYRGDEFIDCKRNKVYLFYVYRRCLGFPFRYVCFRLRAILCRCYKRLFHSVKR